jgi:hypothetical protein
MAICGRSEDYVHLNPVRAKLLGAENRLLEYPWSSFGWYLAGPAHRPEWLRVDRLLGEHGILEDTSKGRQELERRMEARRAAEGDGAEWKGIRRGFGVWEGRSSKCGCWSGWKANWGSTTLGS